MSELARFSDRVIAGETLGRSDALRLVELGRENPYELMHGAYRIRSDRFGRAVRFCSIVPGKTGGCSEDCRWCAQSAKSSSAFRQTVRTSLADILAAGQKADENHAANLGIVNSGRSPLSRDIEDLEQFVRALLAGGCKSRLCASLGEITEDQARRLASLGLTRYHHNLETSERYFPKVVTTHTFRDRIATLQAARRAGMSLCSGGIFGIGESWQDRLDLAICLRDEVRPDVVPLNFLHPIQGTPLEATSPMGPMEALSIVAVFRHLMPDADLKIAGGRVLCLRDMQSWMYYAGATSCMVGDYLTTCGRAAKEDIQLVKDLGLEIVEELPAHRKTTSDDPIMLSTPLSPA
jgi:biotin synthase